MKKAIAIVICFSLLFQCLAHWGIVAYYQINKQYIARNLCENRNKPQMKCCGKCYLKKQLKKVDGNENTSKDAPNKIEKNEVIAYIIEDIMTLREENSPFPAATIRTPGLQHLNNVSILFPIFHPPALAC